MTPTNDELLQLTNEEIIAYMESGEGFVDAPVSEEMLQRNWLGINKKLDEISGRRRRDRILIFLIGFVLGIGFTIGLLIYIGTL